MNSFALEIIPIMTADAASAAALAGLDNEDEVTDSDRLIPLSEESAGLALKFQKLPLAVALAALVLAVVLWELEVAATVVFSVG
jgi:hypothetical protein